MERKMKVYQLFLVVLLMFSFCSEHINGDKITIDEIVINEYGCKYYIWIEGNNFYFYDSIGKYKLGDTIITFSNNKQE